jgi:hypothetical protein
MAKTRKRTAAAPPASDAHAQAAGADERNAPAARGIAPDTPDPDRVARRAYELYQARGGSDGGALEDWLAAEQELNRSAPDGRDE